MYSLRTLEKLSGVETCATTSDVAGELTSLFFPPQKHANPMATNKIKLNEAITATTIINVLLSDSGPSATIAAGFSSIAGWLFIFEKLVSDVSICDAVCEDERSKKLRVLKVAVVSDDGLDVGKDSVKDVVDVFCVCVVGEVVSAPVDVSVVGASVGKARFCSVNSTNATVILAIDSNKKIENVRIEGYI